MQLGARGRVPDVVVGILYVDVMTLRACQGHKVAVCQAVHARVVHCNMRGEGKRQLVLVSGRGGVETFSTGIREGRGGDH